MYTPHQIDPNDPEATQSADDYLSDYYRLRLSQMLEVSEPLSIKALAATLIDDRCETKEDK